MKVFSWYDIVNQVRWQLENLGLVDDSNKMLHLYNSVPLIRYKTIFWLAPKGILMKIFAACMYGIILQKPDDRLLVFSSMATVGLTWPIRL